MIHLLLVDDHAMVRAGIRQFLEESAEITVTAEADDASQAQTILKNNIFDMAVVDIHLPQINGFELTKWIKQHHPNLPVLILTAHDDEPYVVAALQAGANGYVLKDATAEELTRAVQTVYEGQNYISSAVAGHLFHQITQPMVEDNSQLTERELEVLTLVADGLTNKEIGVHLDISSRTVQTHLANVYAKLDTHSRTKAVTTAIELGLLKPGG
ncbi:MAG: response regulator transcription factor [Anaerolineales bacterium]|nr:response regulator transcription factor [Anaerolineales bacterium]